MAKAKRVRKTKRKAAKRKTSRRHVKRKHRAVRRPARKARIVKRASRKKPQKKGMKTVLIQQVEKLLGTFSDDMITALDLKDEKKNLLKKINELKREEAHLMDLIQDLESTRDKQALQIKNKEMEEEELKNRVSMLKDEKAGMVSEKIRLNQQINALKGERENLNASLDRTNDLLVRFRHHIEEFDEDLKS
jgi:chromosome segregation ATPase